MTNQYISAVNVAMKKNQCETVLILTKHGSIFVWKILQQSPHLLLLDLLQLDQGVEPGDDDIALTESQMKRAVELGESLPGPLGHLIISATTFNRIRLVFVGNHM